MASPRPAHWIAGRARNAGLVLMTTWPRAPGRHASRALIRPTKGSSSRACPARHRRIVKTKPARLPVRRAPSPVSSRARPSIAACVPGRVEAVRLPAQPFARPAAAPGHSQRTNGVRMELFSTPWWSALLAIVLIDLVLAGDNAIVIALAARNLPRALRTRAVIWGTVGAIAVRSVMTVGVVWLLQIPGLMLVGGLGLLWIAYRLLVPSDDGDAHGPAATTFWGAMKTIVVADALMGIDNVLGVAGAAHGAFDLVVIGLLISVPIVVWGSTLVLRWVERWPFITYA